MAQLTRGGVQHLFGMDPQAARSGTFQPLLQVISEKPVRTMRMVVLSDGDHFVSCVLTQAVEQECLLPQQLKHAVIRLIAWEKQQEKAGHSLWIIKKAQFVQHCSEIIGQPVSLVQRPAASVSPQGDRAQPAVMGQPPQQMTRPVEQDFGGFSCTQPGNPYEIMTGGPFGGGMQAPELQQPPPQQYGNQQGQQSPFQPQQQQQFAQQPQQGYQHQPQAFQQQQGFQPLQQQPQMQQQPPMQPHMQQPQQQFGQNQQYVSPVQQQRQQPAGGSPAFAPAPQFQQQSPQQQFQQQAPHQQQQPQQAIAVPAFGPGVSPLQQQPQRAATPWGPAGSPPLARPGGEGFGPDACVDIPSLTPYQGKRWRIKGRITMKSEIRRFNNARGPGQLFKIDISDRTGAEVTATFFGGAVDEWFSRLKPRKVYFFSGGFIKTSNPRYDKGAVVITFEQGCAIEEAPEDPSIPGIVYDFRTIDQIQSLQNGVAVDLKGVISASAPPMSITMRNTGEQRPKRSIIVWDNSGPNGSSHIEVTFWGDRAMAEYPLDTPVFIKGVRISTWQNAKALNSADITNVDLNVAMQPGMPELLNAWNALGRPQAPIVLRSGGGPAKRATVQELHDENMSLGPVPQPGQPLDTNGPSSIHRHTVVGTVTTVYTDRPVYYAACPQQVDDGRGKMRTCNKKLQDEGGMWQCANGHMTEHPTFRYICRARLADHTSVVEASVFDEAGTVLFGCHANDLAALWDDEARNEELQAKLRRPNWGRYVFNLKSNREVWQDEERVKVSIAEVYEEDILKEARRKLAEIHATFSPGDGAAGDPKNGGA